MSSGTAVARKGKVMHIPGISKKAAFRRLTINDFTIFIALFFFHTSFIGTGSRWGVLQNLRGTNQPPVIDSNDGFKIIHESIATMITMQTVLITIGGFALVYFQPFFRGKVTLLRGFFHLILAMVISILAALSLPTQGNNVDTNFPKWASERYGVELDSADSKFFTINESLIKSKAANEFYQINIVDNKIYLHKVNGDELPVKTNGPE